MAQGRYPLGMVLGKFLPPHAGHLHLIEFARARCERLLVLACSLKEEPIAGHLRSAWLKEILGADDGIEVIHVTDENPQYPHEHPDFWAIWRRTVERACPRYPQVIFSSEDYGEPFARVLGMEHVACDIGRERVPVSGSAIRGRPLAHWRFIPKPVRPWFARRVVVTGPESTGKSTLAEKLARHLDTLWVPEFARGYLDELNARRQAPHFVQYEDIEPIARGQVASEEALARDCNGLLICDTDLHVTSVYSHFYFRRCPPWVEEEALRRPYARHLFCEIDTPWVADAQRDQGSPEQRKKMRELFVAELARGNRKVSYIHGAWDQRMEQALEAVATVLHEA